MKEIIRTRFEQNIARVRNLIDLYSTRLAGEGQGRRPVNSTDILRAAVVLLHATLEDFLRSLALWKLPLAGEEVLNRIPFPGEANPKAITLGKLAPHRNRQVQDLIKLSVETYLEHSNYNNTDDIALLLREIQLDRANVRGTYSRIDRMISRRHQIVHRADRNERPGQGQHRACSLGRASVNNWVDAVTEFVTAVLDEIPDGE
jgi:hypothetical protein